MDSPEGHADTCWEPPKKMFLSYKRNIFISNATRDLKNSNVTLQTYLHSVNSINSIFLSRNDVCMDSCLNYQKKEKNRTNYIIRHNVYATQLSQYIHCINHTLAYKHIPYANRKHMQCRYCIRIAHTMALRVKISKLEYFNDIAIFRWYQRNQWWNEKVAVISLNNGTLSECKMVQCLRVFGIVVYLQLLSLLIKIFWNRFQYNRFKLL